MDDYSKLSASDGTGEAVVANVENARLIGATTLDVDNVDNWPTEFICVTGTLNPNNYIDNASMTIFYGHLDAGNIVIDSFAPGYTDAGNTAGQIAIIKPTTEWVNQVVELARVSHNDDGTLKASAVEAVAPGGWNTGALPAFNTATYNGGGLYTLVFNGSDYTDTVSDAMLARFTRSVTPPTQCTDLESGSSQYWSKTSPAGTTYTDDFCTGAWVKLESYTGTAQGVIARYNGTSGWRMDINADGTVRLIGYNAGAANFSYVASCVPVPLNRWVHIAAQLDMSAFTATATTSYVMMDGVDVPAFVARGGTNPTALVQAGDLNVGAVNGSLFLDGKIAQAWYSNAKITQSTIQTFISQGMTGSETSIVSHYDFNGDANDNNANANNLSAVASAGYATDSPFSAIEYGKIIDASFSTDTTLTVQAESDSRIPTSGGVSAVDYSTQQTPYGFPVDGDDWRPWIPTFSNFTLGNGLITAFYRQEGKTVTCRLSITLGSTSSMGSAPTFTLPVTAVTYPLTVGSYPLGGAAARDVSAITNYPGYVRWQTTTTANIVLMDDGATGLTTIGIAATSPFTWTTSDEIGMTFTYQAE